VRALRSLRGTVTGTRIRASRRFEARATTRDPIDVASGEVVRRQVDVDLPGVLPLVLERTHVSSYREGRLFGPSWASTLDQRVEVDAEGVYFVTADGMILAYPPADEPGVPVLPVEGPRWPLTRTEDGGHEVTIPGHVPGHGQVLRFVSPAGGPAFRLASIEDRNGNRFEVRYDDDGTPVAVHGPGHQVAVETDGERRVTAFRLVTRRNTGDVTLIRYGYDAAGNLSEVINSSGRPLRFDYDGAGRLTGWTDRIGHWYRYTYDERGRAVRGHGSGGFLDATLTYGERITVVTDSLGHPTTYHLNDAGQVIAEIGPLGHTVRSVWDRHDRPLARTGPLGHETTWTYDERGDLTAVVRPDGARITMVHDASGLPVSVTGPDGAVWRQEYDDRGNLVAGTDPMDATTRYSYDERGHLIAVTGPLGAVTRLVTDAAGLPVAVTGPMGGTIRCSRDPLGRIVALTDPAGGTTRFTWTPEGWLTSRMRPDGTAERWSHDAEGNVVEYTDAAGGVTRYEITCFDLRSARVEPDGTRLEFAYDTELRPVTVTGPQGLTWRYDHDAAGSLVQETDVNGRVVTRAYDAAGRPVERVNGAGQTTRYTYDGLGDVVAERSGDAVTTYAYDLAGRLVRAANAHAEVRFERDRCGRVIEETCNGRTVASAYDRAGRRVRRETPSGVESAWVYDLAGRPVALRGAGPALWFGYDAAGREIRRDLGAAVLDQQWDAMHRLRAQTVRGAGAEQRRVYTYRPDGHVTEIEDLLAGTRRFTLDAGGRITAVHAHGRPERYTYDAAGKITHATWPGADPAAGAREYSGSLIRRAGTVHYEHDAQGRVVRRGAWHHTWDADDRLVGVVTPDGVRWRYDYDPLGRRIAKQRLAPDGDVVERTEFAWDGLVLAEQTHTTAGSAARVTTWDHDGLRPVGQTERTAGAPPRFHAIVTDVTGSPAELIGVLGEIAPCPPTTIWGRELGGAEIRCPLRSPGQYHDPETGAHYNRHRYYDPGIARFHSADPLGLAADTDPHAYVRNPIRWIDPLGLSPYEASISGVFEHPELTPAWGSSSETGLSGTAMRGIGSAS
jgi:RHS repeat-associated protein